MSFYRKYRPQRFSEIVEQDHVRRTFLNALKRKTLSHAHIFTGTRGTGKTSAARIVARALNCEQLQSDGEPCNECGICRDALDGRLVDIIEIDAASNRGIDEIRDLKEKIAFSPSRGRAKIYIIDEVHMLTAPAFNALLKTLEEPPSHAYFILATTEPHRVPETILSRCQRFDFHRIKTDAIAQHLALIAKKEKITAETAALELIARQSSGGMRDALGMLEQLGANGSITAAEVAENLGLARPLAVENFASALLTEKLSEALETIDNLVREGVNLIQFNKAVLGRLREAMLQKVAENNLGEAKTVLKIVAEFARAGEELKSAVIPQLPLEAAAILICGTDESAPTSSSVAPSETASVKTTPTVEKKKTAVAAKADVQKSPPRATSAKELSDVAAANALPKVAAKAKLPALKLVLKECVVVRAGNGEIILGIGSDFLLEKFDTPGVKNELRELFSAELDTPTRVQFERAEIEIATSAPEPKLEKSDLADAAESLFAE